MFVTIANLRLNGSNGKKKRKRQTEVMRVLKIPQSNTFLLNNSELI